MKSNNEFSYNFIPPSIKGCSENSVADINESFTINISDKVDNIENVNVLSKTVEVNTNNIQELNDISISTINNTPINGDLDFEMIYESEEPLDRNISATDYIEEKIKRKNSKLEANPKRTKENESSS